MENIVNRYNGTSPSGLYYYLHKPPKELNKAALGCSVAFFSKANKLIYFRGCSYAHELNDPLKTNIEKINLFKGGFASNQEQPIDIVQWSLEGNMAYLLEYTLIENVPFYEGLLLNLKLEKAYRADFNEYTEKSLGYFYHPFSEEQVYYFIDSAVFRPADMIQDSFRRGIFSKWR